MKVRLSNYSIRVTLSNTNTEDFTLLPFLFIFVIKVYWVLVKLSRELDTLQNAQIRTVFGMETDLVYVRCLHCTQDTHTHTCMHAHTYTLFAHRVEFTGIQKPINLYSTLLMYLALSNNYYFKLLCQSSPSIASWAAL